MPSLERRQAKPFSPRILVIAGLFQFVQSFVLVHARIVSRGPVSGNRVLARILASGKLMPVSNAPQATGGSMATRSKRLITVLSIGVVLIFCAIFYTRYFLARPIGAGPAGPPVDRSAFSEPWTQRSVRLIGIGDSITAGLGADSPDHTFFNRLIKNPDDEYLGMQGICLSRVLPNLQYENYAISGSTSREHLAVIDERLETHDTEVFGLVVMTTGGNDLIHSYGRRPPKECAMYGATLAQAGPWIDAFKVRLDEMLEKIDACFPGGCEVYLADIYDPTDGVGDAPSIYLPDWPDGLAIHAKYNEVIAECAESHADVHVVRLHEMFLGHGAHCRQFWRATYKREDPYYWFYDNIEDPNDRGYDAIRRTFLNSVVEHSVLYSRRETDPNRVAEQRHATGPAIGTIFSEGSPAPRR